LGVTEITAQSHKSSTSWFDEATYTFSNASANSEAAAAFRGDVTIFVRDNSSDEQIPRIMAEASTPVPMKPIVCSVIFAPPNIHPVRQVMD
jgi:hypothetical protein